MVNDNDDTIYEPWDEGVEACNGGMDQSANPYPKGTFDYEQWNEGWVEANKDMERNI